jgi:Putative restriction endonuclease
MIATTTAPRPKPDYSEKVNGEQHLLLSDVSWQSYVTIGNALLDRPALRLTFDRGKLEFMTTSPKHEIYKKWLSRFVDILAEEFSQPKISAGNMTFQKEELEKGIEADDCFWIINESAMRGKLTWDPKVDPLPDLGLEIEISRSVLNRLDIYAALRILEVWCFNGMAFRIYRLQADGTYKQVQESQLFPKVPLGELVRFFALIETTDDLTVCRQFREWVRQFVGKKPG